MRTAAAIATLMILLAACGGEDWRHKSGKSDSDAFIDSCYDMIYRDCDSLITMLESYETDDSVTYWRLNNVLSRAYYSKGFLKKAAEANARSLDYCNRMPDTDSRKQVLGESLNSKAVYMMAQGQNDSALDVLTQAYSMLRNGSNPDATINTMINIADNYYSAGDFTSSSQWYHEALLMTDSLGTHDFDLPLNAGLGKLYIEIGNYVMADRYLAIAESAYPNSTVYEKFYFCNTRGNYYYYIGNYDEALLWFRKAYDLINGGIGRMTSSCNMGEVFIYLNKPDSAERYVAEASVISDSIGGGAAGYYVKSIHAFLALQEKDYATAGTLLDELRHYKGSVSPEYIYLLNKRLNQFYEGKKDYCNAYRYLREVNRYDDSLRNQRTLNNLAEASYRYRNDTTIIAKNKKIEESKREIDRLTFITTVSVMSLAIAVLLFSYITLLRRKRLEHDRQMYAKAINEYRMQVIKNRVTPHFIFNVLNAIMPSLRSHKELEAPIRSMVRLLRSGVTAATNITVSIEDEMQYVKDYITLFTISKGMDVDVTWDISPTIDTTTRVMPTMFLQLPVENALKYAFTGISTPRLAITIADDCGTVLTIEDNGTGFNETDMQGKKENGTGTGLATMKEIIRMLNRNRSKNITMAITTPDDGHGTRIVIRIPHDERHTQE